MYCGWASGIYCSISLSTIIIETEEVRSRRPLGCHQSSPQNTDRHVVFFEITPYYVLLGVCDENTYVHRHRYSELAA
jgi:hypothetical protein